MGYDAGRYQSFRERKKQLHIASAVGSERDLEVVSLAAGLQPMGRGIGLPHLIRVLDCDAEAWHRRATSIACGVPQAERVPGAGQQLGITQHDLPGFTRLNGKDLRTDQPMAGKR